MDDRVFGGMHYKVNKYRMHPNLAKSASSVLPPAAVLTGDVCRMSPTMTCINASRDRANPVNNRRGRRAVAIA